MCFSVNLVLFGVKVWFVCVRCGVFLFNIYIVGATYVGVRSVGEKDSFLKFILTLICNWIWVFGRCSLECSESDGVLRVGRGRCLGVWNVFNFVDFGICMCRMIRY